MGNRHSRRRTIQCDLDHLSGNRRQLVEAIKQMASIAVAKVSGPKDVVSQWVQKVNRYSSQYDNRSWPATCVIGPPSVYPQYGDIAGAWASREKDANQFIEVEFEEAVFITGIDIYETYHAGGVTAVKALTEDQQWTTLWSTNSPTVIKSSRIFKPPIPPQSTQFKQLRIDVDCSVSHSWVEIDAIQLHGVKYLAEPPPSANDLVNDYKLMVNDPQFSDCEFLIEKEHVFYAHKIIICTRSDYFKAMFRHQTKESMTKAQIPILDICKDSFYGVLYYLYTNMLPDRPVYDCIMLTDLWRVADRLSLEGLKKLSVYAISLLINETNVVDVYVAAANSCPIIEEVENNCILYMSNNLSKIVNTPSFTQLPQDIMLEIIQTTTSKLQIK